jgi:hypothetical protein
MQLSRFVLPAVMVLGSAVPFLAPATAQAHEPVRHEAEHCRHRHHCYEVMYRCRSCDPWRWYGRFESRREARCAEDRLEHQGFQVFIER